MKHTSLLILAITLLCGIIVAGCSTTSAIPEGEQLYVGIKDITYTNVPGSKKSSRDSTEGVILSIASAVNSVSQLLEGNSTEAAAAARDTAATTLTDEQRKAQKAQLAADAAAFSAAKEEVEAVLAYAPNGSLFGSSSLTSPLKFGLWVYNGLANSKSKVGQWVLKTFGTKPVLVSNVAPDTRAKVATNTLRNYGYFRGHVTYDLLTQSNPKKAKISYTVSPGDVYRFDSIEYRNFPPVADSLLKATASRSLLKKGAPFRVIDLSGEQTRIETLFREHGYFYYSAPYTTYQADTVARPGLVQLRVQPSPERPARVRHPWYIGDMYITVRDQDGAVPAKTRTRRGYTYNYSGDKLPLRQGMWRQAISHKRGELYRLSHQQLTLEKLSAIGVFSSMDLNYVPRDTTPTCDTLDVYVSATMDKLYDSALEMNATLKSNQQVGPGVSYELAKRNAFRGGERVSFKIFGSYEWQTGVGHEGGSSLLNSYELGTQLAFEFPRFVFPGISRRHRRFPSSTVFSLDADWRNRSGFFNMVNFGVNATYKWHKKPNAQHELTLFSLEFDKTLHTTPDFDSIMTANPALYVSMRDQFVPSMSYTFTYTSPADCPNPIWLQLSAKEAGNLVSGIYAMAGKDWNRRDKQLLGSPFAQYVKFTAEVHHTLRLTSDMKLATRLFAGAVASYGNSERAPYSDQFYIGGANSVRAFTVRSAGPGSFKSANSKYAYIDQTGDVKLEANAELRARLFGNLHGAVFLDAGNVWLLRDDPQRPDARLSASTLKRIAVGTGAGLRYDLDFLVLRFDVGVALHAPYDTSRPGFYNIPRFKDGMAYHFAIGYPF